MLNTKLYLPPRCIHPRREPANCHGQMKTYSTWQQVHIIKMAILIRSCTSTANHWNTTRSELCFIPPDPKALLWRNAEHQLTVKACWSEMSVTAQTHWCSALVWSWERCAADSCWSPIRFKLLTQGVGAVLPEEWSEEMRCLKVSVQASLTPATGLANFQRRESVECGSTWNVCPVLMLVLWWYKEI